MSLAKICDVTGIASNKTEIISMKELKHGLKLPEDADDKLEFYIVAKNKNGAGITDVSAVHVYERVHILANKAANEIKQKQDEQRRHNNITQ